MLNTNHEVSGSIPHFYGIKSGLGLEWSPSSLVRTIGQLLDWELADLVKKVETDRLDEHSANYIIPSYCHLPVKCRNLFDRCDSLVSIVNFNLIACFDLFVWFLFHLVTLMPALTCSYYFYIVVTLFLNVKILTSSIKSFLEAVYRSV